MHKRNCIFSYLRLLDIPNVLFHGTSDTFNLAVGDVLLPPLITRNISEKDRKINLDKVFVTGDYNYAKIYAGRCIKQYGGNPVILTVKTVGIQELKPNKGNTIYTCDHAYIQEIDGLCVTRKYARQAA